MKTKNLFKLALILVPALVLSFTSCKKDKLDKGTADPTSLQQLAADENNVEGVMNNAESDVTTVMANSGLKSGWAPCNATLDSVGVANDTITMYITYNGLNCAGNRTRTGKIEIQKKVGTHWEVAGTSIIYKYINYKETKVSNGKSITLNGSKTFTNVSGGHRWQVGTLINSYVERVSGAMEASLDNGENRTWNVARQITFTGTPTQFIFTIDGFGSAANYQNLVEWGTNRNGEEFYTQITQSVVCKQTCDWNPVSGIKVHQIPSDNKSATITFGYDSNNQPITGTDCPTRFRVDWQKNNQSGTSFLPL